MKKIARYVLADILRSRAIMAYTAVLLVLATGVFHIEDNADKGVLSLLNIVLFVVPLVSIVFSTVYLYNSAEFIELLAAQPLPRGTIWMGIFAGLAGSVSLAFLLGVGIPVALYAWMPSGLMLLASGVALSLIFVSMALWTAVRIRDKARGIGLAIFLWLYFALLFDVLLLFALFQFADYPIERFAVVAAMLNPVDIARVLVLLEVDLSAMMGYTGALFRNFFGTTGGMILTVAVLLLWIALPLWLSARFFVRKDL